MKSKKSDCDLGGRPRPSELDFYTAITRMAVAQICQSIGYKAAQGSALDALTDIATRYLGALAKSAASSAISTGRTQPNLLDILRSFEHLHSVLGFPGASNVSSGYYDSALVLDAMKFVEFTPEVPFPKPLPRRSLTFSSIPESGGSYNKCNDRWDWNHIPKWLPPIPIPSEKVVDAAAEKIVAVVELVKEGKRKKKMELPEKRKRVSFKIDKNEVGGI